MALRTLYQTLLDSDFARLRVIAHQWQISLAAERRGDAAAELADALANAVAVERALADLPETSQQALHALLRHEGALPWSIFTRDWGEVRSVGPGRLEREALWRDPISAAEDLWYRGWIQRAFAERAVGQVAMAFVPDELRLYVPPPPPLILPPLISTQSPLHSVMGDDDLVEDLVSFWVDVQLGNVRVSPSLGDKVRRDFLETLSLEQGWVRKESDGGLRLVPNPTLTWLQSSVWEQWLALAQAWIGSETWNDLAHIPSLRPDVVKGWPDVPLAARHCVLDMVRRCEPDQWYAIEDFVAYMREHTTDFLRPDGDYDGWALRSSESDLPLRGFSAWGEIEGALITFLLTGPLAWLGLVDIGRASAQYPITTFRLNRVGMGVLGILDAPTFSEPSHLRFLMDGLLVVPARRRYERFQLSRVAQQVTTSPEGDWHYRFTPKSLTRAQQQRIPLARIFDFLTEATRQTLPVELRTVLESGYTGRAQAQLAHVCLLRVTDDAVLDLPTVRPLIQEQIAPTMALIRERDYARVLSALTRAGILADFED